MKSRSKKTALLLLAMLGVATTGIFFAKTNPNYLKGNLSFVPCINPSVGTGPYTTFVDDAANALAPYNDIQTAIDASQNGDVIVVCPGNYGGFQISNREITLRGLGSQPADVNITQQGMNRIATIKSGSAVEISNMKFENGQSQTSAGAIMILGSEVKLVNMEFMNNQSPEGGAIYAGFDTKLIIDSSTFEANQAVSQGGAIAGGGDVERPLNITIINSEFKNNQTTGLQMGYNTGGGAIWVYGDEDGELRTRKDGVMLEINSSVFEDNRTEAYGGAISASVAFVKIINSTFADNSAAYNGGGFFGQALQMKLDNAKWQRNISDKEGGAISILGNDPSPIRIFNSHFEGNRAKNRARQAGSAIYLTNFGQILNGIEFKNSKIIKNTGENCYGVLGHSQDLGQNRVDDTSCF